MSLAIPGVSVLKTETSTVPVTPIPPPTPTSVPTGVPTSVSLDVGTDFSIPISVSVSVPVSSPLDPGPLSTDFTSSLSSPLSISSTSIPEVVSTSSSEEERTRSLETSTVTAMFAEEPITVDSEGVIISSGPTSSISTSITTGSGISQISLLGPSNQALSSSDSSVDQKSTSMIFATLAPSSSMDVGGSWVEMSSMATNSQHLAPSSNILNRNHPLFALGVVLVSVGGIITLVFGLCLFLRLSKRRRRSHRNMIISFSPASNVTPYAFDSKTYNTDDDNGHVESAYPSTPDFTNINVNGTGNALDRDRDLSTGSRQVPSFYHNNAIGVASTIPRIEVEYLQTTRGDDGFDTFNCAMYPSGTCPLEHENRIRQLGAQSLRVINVPGSPVPSFQTDKLDLLTPDITPLTVLESSRELTPPRPERRIKHVPPPLIFSPSINGWTNSVRGFTPRRSHTTASDSTSTTISSSPSVYAPERL